VLLICKAKAKWFAKESRSKAQSFANKVGILSAQSIAILSQMNAKQSNNLIK
jgi:hypothetical protein